MEVRIDSVDQVEQRLSALGARLIAMWDFAIPVQVGAKPYQDRRSRAQNNLYWKWMGVLAEAFTIGSISYTKEDLHAMLVHKFLGTREVNIAGEVFDRPVETSKLGKGGMAGYMHKVEAWATDMGVLLPIPEDNEYAKYREAMQ